jgi:hypothetical protein
MTKPSLKSGIGIGVDRKLICEYCRFHVDALMLAAQLPIQQARADHRNEDDGRQGSRKQRPAAKPSDPGADLDRWAGSASDASQSLLSCGMKPFQYSGRDRSKIVVEALCNPPAQIVLVHNEIPLLFKNAAMA